MLLRTYVRSLLIEVAEINYIVILSNNRYSNTGAILSLLLRIGIQTHDFIKIQE